MVTWATAAGSKSSLGWMTNTMGERDRVMSTPNVSSTNILRKLLEEKPKFHGGRGEVGANNWAIHPHVLEWMTQNIPPGCHTLETGCGYSTVILALLSKHHTVISPSSIEHDRIRKWCHTHAFSTDHMSSLADKSQNVLPGLLCEPLDFVLIDGDHAFPGPFIDWYYVADKVKAGGYIAVDDTQLITGKILRDFLSQEEGRWILAAEIGKTAIFKRVSERPVIGLNWMDQPFCAPPPDTFWIRVRNKMRREAKKLVQKLNGS